MGRGMGDSMGQLDRTTGLYVVAHTRFRGRGVFGDEMSFGTGRAGGVGRVCWLKL